MSPCLVLFELANFLDSALMAAAFEVGFDPLNDDALGAIGAEQIAGKAQHIQVIVAAAEFGGDLVGTGGRPDARKLVSDDRHADAGAADEDAAFDFAAADPAGHEGGEIGVVDAGVARRAFVDDLMALGLQQRDHSFFEMITAVIAGNGYFHGSVELGEACLVAGVGCWMLDVGCGMILGCALVVYNVLVLLVSKFLLQLFGVVFDAGCELSRAVPIGANRLTDGIGDIAAVGH